MTLPLMPKATAVWLVENTGLTFQQIADFCGMHALEVQGIADGEVAAGIVGVNPITAHQVTAEEIKRCEADDKATIKLAGAAQQYITKAKKKKTGRYTPVARRQDKPDAVAWLLKNHPNLTDAQITRLIGTTKSTIKGLRERSHWNISNITPKDPVLLGLCTQTELDGAVFLAKEQVEKAEADAKKAKEKKAAKPKAAPKKEAKAPAKKADAKKSEAKSTKASAKKKAVS